MSEIGIQLKANSALLTEEAVLQEALFTWLLNYNSQHTRKAYLTALEQFKGFIFSRAGLSLLEVQPAQVIA